jgi:hypothetical protein
MNGTMLRLLIVFVCAAGSLMILQSAFDSSDHKKADKAVRGYVVNGRVFGDWLEARAPNGRWSSEITHSCRGVVRVRYAAPPTDYEFDYEVPAHAIHPGNAAGEQALTAFTAAPAVRSADGGASPDGMAP